MQLSRFRLSEAIFVWYNDLIIHKDLEIVELKKR
ncbi:MAG: hypothetical protein K0R18_1900 [Bacillales bacterium]|jgi:hypothetical protein|nr:hypothetical protein [Bacillales bacterium]